MNKRQIKKLRNYTNDVWGGYTKRSPFYSPEIGKYFTEKIGGKLILVTECNEPQSILPTTVFQHENMKKHNCFFDVIVSYDSEGLGLPLVINVGEIEDSEFEKLTSKVWERIF